MRVRPNEYHNFSDPEFVANVRPEDRDDPPEEAARLTAISADGVLTAIRSATAWKQSGGVTKSNLIFTNISPRKFVFVLKLIFWFSIVFRRITFGERLRSVISEVVMVRLRPG